MKWIVLLTLLCLCQGKKKPPKPPTGNGCPAGWTKFGFKERCFYISANSTNYENAKKSCASQKSELAPTITCTAQNVLNTALVAFRRECTKKRRMDCEEFWIGIDKIGGSSWNTARGIDILKGDQCQPWATNYPKVDGRCVLMSYQDHRKRGTWQNADCAKELRYVCMTCPNEFYYMPESNVCLRIYNTWKVWSDARKSCVRLSPRAELVSIKSPRKQAAVARFLQTADRAGFPKAGRRGCRSYGWTTLEELFWTAGQTRHPSNCKAPFVWKPLRAASENFTYSHWYPGTPNCGYELENCVAVSSSNRYNCRWEDIMCNSKWCSLCEI